MPRDPPVTITVRPCSSLNGALLPREPGRRQPRRSEERRKARFPPMPFVTLVRHATLVVELGDQRILIDPMLDDAGVRPPVANTPNQRANPLVELPPNAEAALGGLTAAIVTHLHADHLDEAGAGFLAG